MKKRKPHHGCCWCKWCDILREDCSYLTESIERFRAMVRSGKKIDINEDIKYEEYYGKAITLWIFSPMRKEWIKVDDLEPGFNFVPYDVNNRYFMKALSWLNVGAFWFPADVNPNYEKVLAPIYLPPEWLQQYGIVQENLSEKSALDAFMASRSATDHNHIDRAKAKVAEAQKAVQQAAKTPLEKAIDELSIDWQNKSNYPPILLDILKKKGYNVIQNDQNQIKIHNEDSKQDSKQDTSG